MCPPVELTQEESRRAAARERVAASLRPGARVEVVPRIIVNEPPKGEAAKHFTSYQKSYRLDKLALWKQPSSTGPALARQWRDRRRDWTFKEELERHKGPVLFRGERATVMAVLLNVDCELTGSRQWALLLSDSGELGWCYALDGLRVLEEFRLSPAGGV